MPTLFEDTLECLPPDENFGPGTPPMRGFARTVWTSIIGALFPLAAESSFRHIITPGGFRMSVAITNCGSPGRFKDG